MKKVILIGGAAGKGTAKTSHMISQAFVRMGYYVFNYRDYPSLITGGHNFNVVTISDKPVNSHENKYDIIIAFDQKTIDKHKANLKENGFIIADKNLKAENLMGINVKGSVEKLDIKDIAGNNIFIGYLMKMFGLPADAAYEVAEKEFGEKAEPIKNAIKEGYESVEKKENLDNADGKAKYFISGNEAIASGAIASGIDSYIAYPITPATPVLHILASKQIKYNFIVNHIENEIAVANAALGASYAGAMTMVGTSGAGFSLMAEAMSLQGISEVPLVLYLSQRTGPGTGVPTYTAQADLKFALNVGHGEFPRIVVAPGDAKEAFYRTIECFYLAYKHNMLAILLGDKHLGESNYTVDDFEEPAIRPERSILKNPGSGYKSYALTETGVSPRAVPGQIFNARATSYEHNEYGHTTEESEWSIKMNDKRLRKIDAVKKDIEKLNPVFVYGKGKNLIIGWGSTKGAILDALPKLPDFKFMQISYISPFPADRIREEIEKSDNIVLIENNATGLLGDVIAEQTGKIIKNKILKYDARPFTSTDIVDKMKKMLLISDINE